MLLAGLLVNACRLNRLLSSSTPDSAAGGGGSGGGPLVVTPPAVRDSAIAGATTLRVTTLDISNHGGWTASTPDDWINFTPASGGAHTKLRLSLDPKDLDPGTHSGALTIAERASGDTVTVPVSFHIQQPVLKVDPGSLSHTANSSDDVFYDTLKVTNEGDGPLTWTVTTAHHAGWLTLGDTSGTAPGQIPVRITNAGLSYFGTFTETIVVTAPGAKNSPKNIQVTLRRKHHDG
jgi:hypothetical protein